MNDLNAAVPASVTVVFPRVDTSLAANARYSIEVTLVSLLLQEYGTARGFTGTQIIHCSAIAASTGGGAPSNLTQLTTLAERIARDFYLYALNRVALELNGVRSWTPEGISNCIVWEQRDDEKILTRIERQGYVADQQPGLLIAGSSGSMWWWVVNGGLVVEDVDGSPLYLDVHALMFDQADGFTLSQPAAGVVRIDVKDEKVKVSSNDTTANYLSSKLVALGTTYYVAFIEQNDGGNETLAAYWNGHNYVRRAVLWGSC